MKYLGIHKLLWFLFALFWTTVEIILIGIAYIAYIVWNFKFPKGNLWYNFHSYRSKWDGQWVQDHNPWQTIARRYNCIN